MTIEPLILPKLTGDIPNQPIDSSMWNHLRTLSLADPHFHKPGSMDLLLGADIFGQLLLDGKIVGPHGSPIAQNSVLGWILSGRVSSQR